ncbi:DEAD/DEAH box helicase [Gulosibacter chungangensis]|uniref:DEAD/DEAH box helicase n=1 Tax=Gulosibacter chungangensis TaxID=979746 RepID=A0A7J5BE28_9MICO|nr:DEAD/DEAH box helicase [Gulosibacter chungangensis]KAB1643538.1 DEAD/DEAH box helicase [Gulosibacter chungangensis]
MTALLPSLQAGRFQQSVSDYLQTTFALTDKEVLDALDSFLADEHTGIFRGPYLRTRMPFKPATRKPTEVLEWYGAPYPPHGHQMAAFERLAQGKPTLVTTGTGSGKTEAFLFPILDHVLRAKRNGIAGTKALILYPMNALANDQARRIASLITTDPELAGVSAAIYTGEDGPKRRQVSPAGLITDRETIQAQAPDILLTNYKMLDQLLLRSKDQTIWEQSATSLRFLVLDEFHTYDGAQGTDVAMLLRRLGMTLKRHWPTNPERREALGINGAAAAAPLGLTVPVATSATLGGEDSTTMIDFANTVFGGGFDADSAVGETRYSVEDWAERASETTLGGAPRRFVGIDVEPIDLRALGAAANNTGSGALDIARAVIAELYESGHDFASASAEQLHDALRTHPDVRNLIEATQTPTALGDLVQELFSTAREIDEAASEAAINAIIAALSQVRMAVGFAAPSVDVNAWIRALTRIDRVAGPTAVFRWSDDGQIFLEDNDDAYSDEGRESEPAIYCRHCGRSGWGVAIRTTGEQRDLEAKGTNPREVAVKKLGSFRALIYAPAEADKLERFDEPTPGFGWWDVNNRRVHATLPETDGDSADTKILPVQWFDGEDADRDSNNEICPSCGRPDGIRFMGSAVATLLSVVTTALFGDAQLDGAEKKALVFTDSVQDAAHRAGFVQNRAHTFGLRNAIRRAIGDRTHTLEELSGELLARAETANERYRLLSPELAERENFREFWETEDPSKIKVATRRRVKTRLAFDLALEFGLQSTFARTLEQTASVTAEVDTGPAVVLERIAREAIEGFQFDAALEQSDVIPGDTLIAWARGVLEQMRERGAIEHQWLGQYVKDNGLRWKIWGGRPKAEGMPAFPKGRSAPAFPRIGPNPKTAKGEYLLDDLNSSQGWYARWTARILGVSTHAGAQLVQRLLKSIADGSLVKEHAITRTGGTAYGIEPERILVSPASNDQRHAGETMLRCDSCKALTPASPTTVAQLEGRPCPGLRCSGTLERLPLTESNYYRHLYEDSDMRRVIAREHTSLLPDDVRLTYETAFKSSDESPDAPNVLVATPTLEMGIDIGDLSTVMLASLPRTVANYVQRVGRAGRLTGSALALAFVPGRHEQLAWYQDPLELINGEVTAPATYLDAVGILKRQFLASVFDHLATNPNAEPLRLAKDVLTSTEPDSPLGDVLAELRASGAERLARFLSTFDHPGGSYLRESTRDALVAWLRPRADGSLPVEEAIATAANKYVTELESVRHRLRRVQETLVELQQKLVGVHEDEDVEDERNARATWRMLEKIRDERENDHWVSALERAGLLPNYTLLDDRVTLDVGVSWVDADTQQFENTAFEYSRDAGNAIREFAPGATFYAQGLAIEIDSVETGANASAIHDWVCCPECGHTRDLTEHPLEGSLGVCPRCGSAGFADMGQRMPVIELESVSAQVRRDESLISDSSEDRVRAYFNMVHLADIDAAQLDSVWFDEGTGLGVKYAREVTIRSINLGKSTEAAAGTPRLLGGFEIAAPMFRICRECGHLDQKPDENSWREHKPWCSHRKHRDEDAVSVALSRTLETQGMLIRLPEHFDTGDELVLPSLMAAVHLGLREVIGGDPSHLDIISVKDVPHGAGGTTSFPALLVHDRVPGGTGYLADHSTVAGLEQILLAALAVVENCVCQTQGRSACHRCLLPFAPPGASRSVWRNTAERSLREMLGVPSDRDEPVVAANWKPVTEDPGKTEAGSALERRFRKAFLAGVETLGGNVQQQPGVHGNTVLVTLPRGHRRTLKPEEHMRGARPDFVLRTGNADDGALAIFLDGYRYHATEAINRLADDHAKRAEIRSDIDVRVISLTWEDVEDYLNGTPNTVPQWIAANPLYARLGPALGLNAGDLERVTENPMRRIFDWMRDPQTALNAWDRILPALPTLLLGMGQTAALDGVGLDGAAVRALDGSLEAGNPGSAQWRQGTLAVVTRVMQAVGGRPTYETAIVLDDSSDALARPEFRSDWRSFLHWSNVLGVDTRNTTIRVRSQVASAAPVSRVDVRFQEEWIDALEYATADEKALLQPLQEAGFVPAPEVGEERGDGVTLPALWEAAKVALVIDLDEAEVASVRAEGYDTLDDVAAVLAHFAGASEGNEVD